MLIFPAFRKLMQKDPSSWFIKRVEFANAGEDECLPASLLQRLNDRVNPARREFNVIRTAENLFELDNGRGVNFLVNLSDNTCSCHAFYANELPCDHAVLAITNAGREFKDHSGIYYRISALRGMYAVVLEMVPLEMVRVPDAQHVNVPPVKRGVGAPKKKRIRTRDDAKLIMCGKCKKLGHHNARSCTA